MFLYIVYILVLAMWFVGYPCGSAGKESACNVGDLGSIPGLGRSPREGNSYPLQYSGMENCMDCIVHGVAESQTWLSDFHFTSLHVISKYILQTCSLFWKEKWIGFSCSLFLILKKALRLREVRYLFSDVLLYKKTSGWDVILISFIVYCISQPFLTQKSFVKW